MRKSILYIGFVLWSFIFISCDEVPPYIDFTQPHVSLDTNYLIANDTLTAELRNVLIEDFTGVRCQNCPKAHEQINTLKNLHAGRIVSMAIHPKALSALTAPFKNENGLTSKQDFTTQIGAELLNNLGGTNSLPIGDVNRKMFMGESSTLINYSKWPSYVDAELANPTPVNFDKLAISYNATTKTFTVQVKLHYTANVSDSNYLSVYLAESKMSDIQEDGSSGSVVYTLEYQHNHVLRNILTSVSGDLLKASLQKGRVFDKTYTYTINMTDAKQALWNPANVSVIAMVHKDAAKKEIIHVKEAAIQ